MITRACISINNSCNLNCAYCHFHTPDKALFLADVYMDVYKILDNIKSHIDKYSIKVLSSDLSAMENRFLITKL